MFLLLGMLTVFHCVNSQTRVSFIETFDGSTQSFTMLPSTSWMVDTGLNVNGKSCWGFVPDTEGDSAILLSPIYDLQSYGFAYLRFTHICKITEFDVVTVEYKEDYVGSRWKKIPSNVYRGTSVTYRKKQTFHDKSYNAWISNDLFAEPNNSWWRTESFDVSQEVSFAKVQFRFKIVKGSETGSQFAWGWLIDNFELIASTSEINPPVVELMNPIIEGKIFGTGPFQIIAKAAPRTIIPLQTPILKIKHKDLNGVEIRDSVSMTLIEGDSIWMGVIPQFPIGTNVDYIVYATDSVGNNAMVNTSYFIDRKWGFDSNTVAINSIDTPFRGSFSGVLTPVTVTIENRGLKQLSSAVINWSLNGVQQPTTFWSGSLNEGFSEQVNIGSFLPQFGKYDTISAWVSFPNGVVNSTTDTIVHKVTFGCDQILSGDYTVGPTGDFPSVNDALDVLILCGTAGNVNLKLQNGIYEQTINLHNLNQYTGAYDVITITSLSGNAADVILKNEKNKSSVIEIDHSHNVVIKNVTIDATTASQGINFLDTAYNIEINGCEFLLDSTTKINSYGIYKNQNTGLVDRIRIVNNTINGGTYGIYIFGLDNANYNTNLYIDNNTIKNSLTMGIFLRFCQFYSISENKIFSRISYAGNGFNAIYSNYCHGLYVTKNIIRSYSSVNMPIALEFSYLNHLDTINMALIANNEIIVFSNSRGGSGLTKMSGQITTFTSVCANIYHNSILKKGEDNIAGMYISNPVYVNIQNNSIVTEMGYPIQCVNTKFGITCFMNYNNYYSILGNYVAYYGSASFDIPSWYQTTGQDSNSISMLPHYIDTAKHLQLTNYIQLECPISPLVGIDILDSIRIGITAMGCYTPSRLNFDIIALGADNWLLSKPANQSTYVDAVFMNIGSYDTLQSITLNWSVNGVLQTPFNWTGSLFPYMDTIARLGSFLPQSGYNHVKVWLSQPNGQLADMNPFNDTTIFSVYGCNLPMNGTYTVGGPGADFSNPSEALKVANYCGINGLVRFVLDSGLYYDLAVSGSIPGSDSINTITFTSLNRNNVIMKGMTNVITLTNTAHLIFDNLTIDAFDLLNGIVFYGTCSDIEIRNCYFILDSTTSEQQMGIYLNNNVTLCDRIRIVNNIINGGYYGVNMTGGSTSLGHSTRFVLDSNTFKYQYCYGANITFVDLESVSNNLVVARTSKEFTSWYGIRLFYSLTPKVVGNKIYSFSGQITNPYGLYLSYMNDSVQSLVANNEVIINTPGANYGVYIQNSNIDFYHNSVMIIGKGAGRALNITNGNYTYNIKNNNFITFAATDAYPIYLAGTTYIGTSWFIDYNNYYSNGLNIGYAGGAKTRLSDWKTTVTTDTHSVRILPDFVNVNENLSICKNTGMMCPSLSEVPVDIYNKIRNTLTHMGAYEESVFSYNTKLVSFIEPKNHTASP